MYMFVLIATFYCRNIHDVNLNSLYICRFLRCTHLAWISQAFHESGSFQNFKRVGWLPQYRGLNYPACTVNRETILMKAGLVFKQNMHKSCSTNHVLNVYSNFSCGSDTANSQTGQSPISSDEANEPCFDPILNWISRLASSEYVVTGCIVFRIKCYFCKGFNITGIQLPLI